MQNVLEPVDGSTPLGEKIEHLLRALPIEFIGERFQYLEQGFCRTLDVKKIDQVRADVLVTNQRVIVAPGTKDRSELAALAILFGGGALAGAAAGLLSEVAELWSKSSKRQEEIDERLASEALAGCAVWNRDKLTFEVFEERTAMDLFGGEWATCPRISGQCQYRGTAFPAGVEFSFYGRMKNLPMRSRPKELVPLLDIFAFDPERIERRSIWRKRGK